jgi:hypothetical protein
MTRKIILLAACLCLLSCGDWLDGAKPKKHTEQEELFSRESGFKETLTGAYQLAAESNLYGGKLTYDYLDKLAQRYRYVDNSGALPFQRPEFYEFGSESSHNTIDPIWNDIYRIVANLNNMLHWAERNRGVFTTPGCYEIIRGEGLALRSYLYFDLLRMFGPVYSNNPTARSIVYRTEFDRSTKELVPADEMLRYIISDLETALELLDGTDPLNFDYVGKLGASTGEDPFLVFRQKRMNALAVRALLARVHLYGGNREQAADYARDVIQSGKFALTRNNTQDHILSSEVIFALHVDKMKTAITDRMTYTSQWVVDTRGTDFFDRLMNVSVDGGNDIRVKPGNGFNQTTGQGTTFYVMTKFDQTGLQYAMEGTMPLIRLSEMYYILGEATDDMEWVNEVRDARGILPLTGVDTPAARLDAIGTEYRKEFYGEGQLWYFYKRTAAGSDRFFNMSGIIPQLADRHYIFNVPDDEYQFGGIPK